MGGGGVGGDQRSYASASKGPIDLHEQQELILAYTTPPIRLHRALCDALVDSDFHNLHTDFGYSTIPFLLAILGDFPLKIFRGYTPDLNTIHWSDQNDVNKYYT